MSESEPEEVILCAVLLSTRSNCWNLLSFLKYRSADFSGHEYKEEYLHLKMVA